MNRYIGNPHYTVIDDKLYFICRGGKHIFVRHCTRHDYQPPALGAFDEN